MVTPITRKTIGDPPTPPSAKSESSKNSSSSEGTVATASSSGYSVDSFLSNAGATIGSASGELSVLGELSVPGEESEEEEGESEQEGLPQEIKEKVYALGEEGELQLLKDRERYEVPEDYDIDLDQHGKAHFRKLPTDVHQEMIKVIDWVVKNSQGGGNDKLLTSPINNIKVGKKGLKKEPDLTIHGRDRISAINLGTSDYLKCKTKKVAGMGKPNMNPHVIIEVSWTNDLEMKEIPKFRRQLNQHAEELGIVNLGYLIKSIPAKGSKLPTEAHPEDISLCGFDVYRAQKGQEVVAGEPYLQYRVGGDEDSFLSISSEDLGGGNYSEIGIPLQILRAVLEDHDVTFEEEDRDD